MAAKEDAELEELIRSAGAEPEEESEGGGLDLTTLVMVARKSVPWILLLIVVGVTAAWLFLRYTPPTYKSSSTLKIDEKTEAGVLGIGALGGAAEKQQNVNKLSGEIELIKSDLIYRRLKDSLKLDVTYYVEGTVLESELYRTSPFRVEYEAKEGAAYNTKFGLQFLPNRRFRLTYTANNQEESGEYSFGQPVQAAGFLLRVFATDAYTTEALDGSYHFVINDDASLNEYLNENLLVEIINPEANTIGISFTDHNPQKAQAIVNKIDSVYLVEKILRKQEQAARSMKFLDEQLGENRGNLQGAEENLQAFFKRNKTNDVKADVAQITQLLQQLEDEREKLEEQADLLADLARLIEQDRLTTREDGDVFQSVPALSSIKDGQLTQRIAELSDQQLDLRRVQFSYQNSTDAVKLRQEQIADTKQVIRELLQKNQRLVRRQLAKMDIKQAELEARLRELPEKQTEQARLQRPLELYEKYNINMMDRKIEFGIQLAGTTPDFQILSPATLPSIPISPRRLMVYAIGLAAGVVLGLGLIAARYLLHNTVTNVAELERNTQAPVLGVIPTYEKEKMVVSKLVVDKNPKSAISEAIRSIRTNLEFMASSKKKRLISVTSTVSGEGKTFVTVNLAGIIAASDQRVVILDLDMRKPKINLAFDAENVKGVSTILIEKHTWQECLQHTSIPSLDFISAGPTPPNPSELILSPRFDELVESLFQHYDVVMIDTPPVGLVTDGILIMRRADVPIYIVRANYSKKSFLKNINKLIRVNGFTKLTTILNDAQASSMHGYGYGYGYGYGQGYYEEEAPKAGLLGRLRKQFS
ncbi:GumC family protein [Hymenobacter weizhouensis]|uniref:GumC family protein n=1 Tax=Hymenobacter sp. YIM 151500-1 TaxID=2987689 RepID=UPI002227270E|nr:polysaccharide biosynthesis tyrosine autokinase [Hymenobacter sp. YIM 151500-1]UYZ62811.1 polysaccharide biosynthesis tyrosine autokinase [Hymenobacter sp. YIM 151500-1]